VKPSNGLEPLNSGRFAQSTAPAAGSFGYDPRDDAEVVRIARLIADEPEVASLDHDDLRTALASVRNGSTFTFY
jgi:hypothetical protein